MQSLFAPFQVRVDPWEVDYGSETPLEPFDKPGQNVVVDVEVPATGWNYLVPGPATPPERRSTSWTVSAASRHGSSSTAMGGCCTAASVAMLSAA